MRTEATPLPDTAGAVACAWFALCPNRAVLLKANPLYPEGVPCCQRCADKADRLSRS